MIVCMLVIEHTDSYDKTISPVRTNVWLIVLFCARGVNMDMAAAGQVDKLRHVSAHSKPMRTALSKVL